MFLGVTLADTISLPPAPALLSLFISKGVQLYRTTCENIQTENPQHEAFTYLQVEQSSLNSTSLNAMNWLGYNLHLLFFLLSINRDGKKCSFYTGYHLYFGFSSEEKI